ncbi:N-acetyltransferase B complex non catalytic subunit-domain-containing protein [Schizophyllum amplum]|uniref:N-acetyltransferase B complex non catalytic subunit-domain-containing protein n=1 Tax=Schizophyllum amplum TaxID=97359 RepID=A0A550BUN6_9AGAR|nr:N-acetyltransferase B complex non catalytic subunit-domain-containing protein [Auriculariopsis ampla]
MSLMAVERQMRPIYDALDTGSNKSAIVTCNKLLKKQPKNMLVKALKSLALVRSQKVEESLALCDEVLASKPTEDATLTAMMHVLRGLGRNNDMVIMFEDAFKKQPGNEELGCQTVFANIRALRWKTAQQLSQKLFKTFQDERYLYWSVMCSVMQAHDPSTPATMKPILFKLAAKLLEQSPNPSFVSADRFHLHLAVLKETADWEAANKLLDTDLRREIIRAQGKLREEGIAAEARIGDKGDRNWLEFLSLVDGTFVEPEAEDAQEREKDAKTDLTVSAIGFTLYARTQAKHPGSYVEQLKTYFEGFGTKACCYEDLKPYVLALEPEETADWESFLQPITASFTNANELQRLINAHKLLRYTSTPTVESELAIVEVYAKQYREGLQYGDHLPTTELQPADDLAILAGQTFVSLWSMTGEQKHLFSAAAFLEYALTKSNQAFEMRLMLVRIYRLIAAPSLALDQYRAMGAKHIQQDTLSHFVLSRASLFSLAPIGDVTMMTECMESMQIYLSNSNETSEFITRAFNAEKYSQIPEFIAFEERLETSVQKDLVKLEHLRMRLTHETISNDVTDMELIELKFGSEKPPHDNRDYDILVNYQPANSKSFCEQTTLFGKVESCGWLNVFLKMYIRALQMASDLDETVEDKLLVGDRPKVATDPESRKANREKLLERTDEELAELTGDERALVDFVRELSDWAEPHHNYTRPPPAVVLAEAAKVSEQRTGHPLRGIEIPPLPANGQLNGKKDEEAPPIQDTPERVQGFFDVMKKRFDEVIEADSPLEALEVANLITEAFLFVVVTSMRFKNNSIVKIHKLGPLVQSFKTLRTSGIAVLKEVSASLIARAEKEGTSEARKAFIEDCALVTGASIDHDYVLSVGKKVTDSRKKIVEGLGKGIQKISTLYVQF